MGQKNLDMMVVMVLCVLNMLWALIPSHNVPGVGMVLAMPLIFLLPGYVLTQALLPQWSCDGVQQLAFCIGLSLVLDIIAGLVLNILPGGLHALSWAIFLGLCTMGGALLVVSLRRHKTALAEQMSAMRWQLTHVQVLALELAVVVAVLSVMSSAFGVLQAPHTRFTQFWLLPASQARQHCAVQLGVHSFEASVMTYRVEMSVNGTLFHIWSPVVLEPQHDWEQQVPLLLTRTSTLFIVAHLYLNSAPQKMYRSVNLTLHASDTDRLLQSFHCTS